MLMKKDSLIQAQSGTGKTGAFSISVLQLIDQKCPDLQAIIISPTIVLAQQTFKVIKSLSQYMPFGIHLLTGGTPVKEDINALKSGNLQICVGTPGRILDMTKKGYLQMQHVKVLIMDEADELLSRGFLDQIREFFTFVSPQTQIGLFSATIPPQIVEIAEQFMNQPVKILVANEKLPLKGIKQFFIAVEKEEWKQETLMQLFQAVDIQQCIVFVNSKIRAEEVH